MSTPSLNKIRGRSFLSFLTLLAVVAACAVMGFWYLKKYTAQKRHAELEADLANLTQAVQKQLDCNRTWIDNAVNPELDCLPSPTPKPLIMKNPSGVALTQAWTEATAGWDPLAANLTGSGQAGPWWVRAYCDRLNKTLVIRVARGPFEENKFFTDPLNNIIYDWKASPPNPLFGVPGKFLCQDRFQITGQPEVPSTTVPNGGTPSVPLVPGKQLQRVWISITDWNQHHPHSIKDCKSLSQSSVSFSMVQAQCKKQCARDGFFSGYFEECCAPPECSPSKLSCVCLKD